MGDKSGDFLAGFILGGLVGAAVALLLAPQPGEETRSLLRERGIELKDRADELSTEAMRRAATLQEKSKAAMDAQAARLKEAVEEGKATAEKTKQELLRQIQAGGSSATPEGETAA
jgi:gas vesicle protein